ncbi:MAG: DUF1284 domain-containing protein [Azospirillaceae bacterium]
MSVALRAHHLLCLQTYVGKGYTPAFVANYDAVVARLAVGEAATIVAGPDAICAPLLDDPEAHCRLARVAERDRKALAAVGAVLGRRLTVGDTVRLDPPVLTALRARFATGHGRAACAGCQWHDLCSRVAAGGFQGTRM